MAKSIPILEKLPHDLQSVSVLRQAISHSPYAFSFGREANSMQWSESRLPGQKRIPTPFLKLAYGFPGHGFPICFLVRHPLVSSQPSSESSTSQIIRTTCEREPVEKGLAMSYHKDLPPILLGPFKDAGSS
jgi:hypothetical protein